MMLMLLGVILMISGLGLLAITIGAAILLMTGD